jgi:hypothetical protein
MGWQIVPYENRGAIVVNDGGLQETRTKLVTDAAHDFALALAINVEADVYGPVLHRLYEIVEGHPLVVKK